MHVVGQLTTYPWGVVIIFLTNKLQLETDIDKFWRYPVKDLRSGYCFNPFITTTTTGKKPSSWKELMCSYEAKANRAHILVPMTHRGNIIISNYYKRNHCVCIYVYICLSFHSSFGWMCSSWEGCKQQYRPTFRPVPKRPCSSYSNQQLVM